MNNEKLAMSNEKTYSENTVKWFAVFTSGETYMKRQTAEGP